MVCSRLRYLDSGRVTSPLIRERLANLLMWKIAIQEARVFLINQNLVTTWLPLTGYYDFVKRVFWNIRNNGHEAAIPLVWADLALFVSWGFSADILKSLAKLQGLVL
jgi:hypothetical protein